ncbi:MAG: cyclic nucleotide-binding domain-containing protein [Gammaproteobacteria bacterium]|nr:cyclic nucleotide-binding domain-containing protein [Gammaproteobacteria bacterium]
MIIKEGDDSDDFFYFIVEGRVNIFKEAEHLTISSLARGAVIGLMALIDEKPRSASVKAMTDVKLAKISLHSIQALDDTIYNKVIFNQLKLQQAMLRASNEDHVKKLKDKIKALQDKEAFFNFFVSIVFIASLYVIVMRVVVDYIKEVFTTTFISSAILLGMGLVGAVYVKTSPYPLKSYGLSFDNWRKNVLESLIWTGIFISIVTLVKWLYLLYLPDNSGYALFDFPDFKGHRWPVSLLIVVTYALFSFVQEFIARGFLQSSLQQALSGRFIQLRAILFTTLIFTIFHLHLPKISYAFVVIFPGLFWGTMFAKQRTLVGVTVSHILIGVWIVSVMGFPGLH